MMSESKNIHVHVRQRGSFTLTSLASRVRRLETADSYHGLPDVGQSALGFAFCKLQAADVLQTSFVLAHLLVDDQLHTPKGKRGV